MAETDSSNWLQGHQVQHHRPRQRRLEQQLRHPVLRGVVVLGVPQLQPERALPEGRARELRRRRQLVPLEGLPLLAQEHRHEDQVTILPNTVLPILHTFEKKIPIFFQRIVPKLNLQIHIRTNKYF
jgi:hypothetical protein